MARSAEPQSWTLALGEGPRASAEGGRHALGRYQVSAELGRGAMGRVLLAFDPEIGREVAIKVLLCPEDARQDEIRRFAAEARITGQLEHPGVVPVHDVGLSDDGRLFYVMKRVDGRSLQDLLDAGAPGWTQARLLHAFCAVCDAVAYAHHRGVLHQDLKPGNVMIGAFGEVLVADWGLATLLRAGLRLVPQVEDPRLAGSPGFIAPERVAAPQAPLEPTADQWSLGAILYQVLAGAPPIEGATVAARLAATLREPPIDVRLRDAEREVPDGIAEICMRALEREPADRFPDVAALADAVRGYLEGRDRRARALAEVSRADAQGRALQETRSELARAHADLSARLAALPPRAPLHLKEEVWAVQDGVSRRAAAQALAEVAWVQTLRGALSLVPDLHEAHVRLARHFREEVERAERARDSEAAERGLWLLAQHDRGHHRAFLRGTASFTLVTDPPGAEVFLAPYEAVGRRLSRGAERSLGRTPLVEVDLAPGSYQCRIVAPGRQEVIYPVFLERAGRWDGVRPGDTDPWPVWLPAEGQLGPHEVYVPAGWFLAGGDAQAPDGLSRRRVWVDGLLVQRFPVTNDEYLSFINQISSDDPEAADRLVPRDRTHPTRDLPGEPIFARGADDRWGPPMGVDPASWGRTPVVRLDLARARAFAARRPGWRLPDELEREKVTRGVDGRFFPWGDHPDPAFCNMAASAELPRAAPVDSFPVDTSVYGARGLAGNVRDICGNRWTEAGPAADGQRLVHQPADPHVDYLSARGGAWSSPVILTRAAARFGDPPGVCLETRGTRLVRPVCAQG